MQGGCCLCLIACHGKKEGVAMKAQLTRNETAWSSASMVSLSFALLAFAFPFLAMSLGLDEAAALGLGLEEEPEEVAEDD